jgi:thiamine pyrophosphokinase
MNEVKDNVMPKALIIANGLQPPLFIVRPFVLAAQLVVCADGGANHALKMNIKPHVIIGDFDSIMSSTKHYYSHIRQIVDPDQNSTDLEKAISYCVRQKMASADIVGATGDRLDHTTGTLGCFKKYRGEIDLRVIDSVGVLSLVRDEAAFTARVGEKVSLIPLDRCTGITTQNLKYPLNGESLELGEREGISNQATGAEVRISVTSGTLLLYRFHA